MGKQEIFRKLLKNLDAAKDKKHPKIIKKPSMKLLWSNDILKSIDSDYKEVAIQELVKKFSDNWMGTFSSYEGLYNIISNDFLERSNKVILSRFGSDFPVSPATSVYIRLLSPPCVFSGSTPLEHECFPRKSSFVSYQKYFELITKKPETLDKMQWRVLSKYAERVPLQEALLDKLSPVYTGYFNMLDDVVVGARTIYRDRYRRDQHKNTIVTQMPELLEDDKHLNFLIKQGYPTLENEMHDKAVGTLPPLYILCNGHWTTPKYSFGSVTNASILDAYYWNSQKDDRLLLSLNSMSKEDIECYLTVAFSYCNPRPDDAIRAVSYAWRALSPLHEKISPIVSAAFKKVVESSFSKISADHHMDEAQSVRNLKLLRSGLKQYTSGAMFVSPGRMAEYEARRDYNLSVKEKQKKIRESKEKFLSNYTAFLQTCVDSNVKATKELFDEYKNGSITLDSIKKSKCANNTEPDSTSPETSTTEDAIKRKLNND